MKTNFKTTVAIYGGRRKNISPEAIKVARDNERDPSVLSGEDRIYYFYKLMGMNIEYDEIFPEID